MSYTTPTNVAPRKFLPKYSNMSAYEIYISQIKSTIEPIRAVANGLSYLPPQLGGIPGQLSILNQTLVLQTIDFEVD